MNLFNELVDEALKNKPDLNSLKKDVVEKELLHHDILRIMRDNNLTKGLTLIGGTALRACYGGQRLSEDLDFTGGANFSRAQLSNLAKVLQENLQTKYGLQVTVKSPEKDTTNVDTWKIKVETRKANKSLKVQCINIDICAVPSYESRPMMLLNLYNVDMGTSGLIIQAQSLEEIFADKILAFVRRPNRIKYQELNLKYKDLWDIIWLYQKGIQIRSDLIFYKLQDSNETVKEFLFKFVERLERLKNHSGFFQKKSFKEDYYEDFYEIMPDYLPKKDLIYLENNDSLQLITHLLFDIYEQIKATI